MSGLLSQNEDILETMVSKSAGLLSGSPELAAVAGRANIFAMSEAMVNAALAPDEPGGLSHGLRAALACRIAQLNAESSLAEMYRSNVNDPHLLGICEPEDAGGEDMRLQAILRFVDLVAVHPKDADERAITWLRNAGVSDADIVRLAELIAFLSYQCRLVAGLKLMRGKL